MINFTPHPLIAVNEAAFDPEVHETYYAHHYEQIFYDIADKDVAERISAYRELIKSDLFFIVQFVMEIPCSVCNKPFVVECCNEIEGTTADGGLSLTDCLNVSSREHFKSTLYTIALTIKRIVNDSDMCTAIFSYKVDAASDFLVSIRETLEKPLMLACFPDVLYSNPDHESPSWTKTKIVVKRKSVSRKEGTVEAFGLVEGMPTRVHFNHRIYEDIETWDVTRSPTQMNLVFDAFELSFALGAEGGTELINNTFFHHAGPIARLRDKTGTGGKKLYRLISKTATNDGKEDGKPVLFSPEYWENVKQKAGRHLAAQYLCNPTPEADILLNFNHLTPIDPDELRKGRWKDRFKFLLIDQASDKKMTVTKKGDPWAIGVFSVVPPEALNLDGQGIPEESLGLADVCLEDVIADQMSNSDAIDTIVRMYIKHGFIRQVGVEKVALSMTETFIHDALKAKGHVVSEDRGTLVLLLPRSRPLEKRIMDSLDHPLIHGHLYYSTGIHPKHRDLLKTEMDNFPVYHANILNIFAYLYDMLKNYKFSRYINRAAVRTVSDTMAEDRVQGEW